MIFVKQILKYTKRFAWALTLAYMIAWHNVDNQRVDSKDSIAFHQEAHPNQEDNSLI